MHIKNDFLGLLVLQETVVGAAVVGQVYKQLATESYSEIAYQWFLKLGGGHKWGTTRFSPFYQ